MVTTSIENKPSVENNEKSLELKRLSSLVAENGKSLEKSTKSSDIQSLYNRLLKENSFRAQINLGRYDLSEASDYWIKKNDKVKQDKVYSEQKELAVEKVWQKHVKDNFNKDKFWNAGIRITPNFKLGLQHIPFGVGSVWCSIGSIFVERKMKKESTTKESYVLSKLNNVDKAKFENDVQKKVDERMLSGVEILDRVKTGLISEEDLAREIHLYKTGVMEAALKHFENKGLKKEKADVLSRSMAACFEIDALSSFYSDSKKALGKISQAWEKVDLWKLKMEKRWFGEDADMNASRVLGLAGLVAWRCLARSNGEIRAILGAGMAYKLTDSMLSKFDYFKLEKREKALRQKEKLQEVLDNFDKSEEIWGNMSVVQIAKRVNAEREIFNSRGWKNTKKKLIRGGISTAAAIGAVALLYSTGVDHEVGHGIDLDNNSDFIAHASVSNPDNHFVGFGGHLDHGLGHDVAGDHVETVSDVSVADDIVHETSTQVSNMDAFTGQVMDSRGVNIAGVYEYAKAHNIDMQGYRVEQEILRDLEKYSDPNELKELLENTDKFKIPFMGMGNPDADIHGFSIGNSDGIPTIEDGFGEGDSVPVEVASNHPSDHMPTVESGFGEHEVSSVNYQGSSFYDNHNVDYAHDGVPTVESGFGEDTNTDHVSYDHVSDNASDHTPTVEEGFDKPVHVSYEESTSSAPVHNETVSNVSHPVKYDSYDDVKSEYGVLHYSESGKNNYVDYLNAKPNGDSAQFLSDDSLSLYKENDVDNVGIECYGPDISDTASNDSSFIFGLDSQHEEMNCPVHEMQLSDNEELNSVIIDEVDNKGVWPDWDILTRNGEVGKNDVEDACFTKVDEVDNLDGADVDNLEEEDLIKLWKNNISDDEGVYNVR